MVEKVLVMGGSYFIGKKIVEILQNNGYEVFTLNRGTKPAPKGIKNLICDRNDSEKMQEILKNYKFDVVIEVSGLNKSHSEILCNSINIGNLKSFVFISSSAVYDIDHLNIPYKETDSIKENSIWTFYGQNKIEAELYYTEFFKNTSTKLIILRPPYVYGDYNYAQRESFIFEQMFNDRPIIVPKSNQKLQFIYANDLAKIIIKLLHSDFLPLLSIYNVGSKQIVTAREWVKYCSKAAGKQIKIMEYDYRIDGRNARDFFPFFDYDNVLDVSKINEIYQEETDFSVGLKNAFEWYIANKKDIIFNENVINNIQSILQYFNYN